MYVYSTYTIRIGKGEIHSRIKFLSGNRIKRGRKLNNIQI